MRKFRFAARAAAILLLPAALLGCSGAYLIEHDVFDYRNTMSRTADAQILQNVLRARDKLPIHFAELSSINTTIQQSASVTATLPFGKPNGSTARDSVSPTVGLQNNPVVALGGLETQAFTRGMLTPVDPKIVQQLLDEGIDPRLVLILFFSEVQVPGGGTLLNGFACGDLTNPECYRPLFRYLDVINRIDTNNIRLHSFTELRPVGPPSAATAVGGAKDIAGIDPTKFKLLRISAGPDVGKYQLYSVSEPKLTLCSGFGGKRVLTFSHLPSPACSSDPVLLPDESTRSPPHQQLTIRSAYQIIQFLGQILNLQAADARDDRCLVVRADSARSCLSGDVLFQVNSPRGPAVVSTEFRGDRYTIVDGGCQQTFPCDHSTQVLAILTLLINWNKDAKDIPSPAIVSLIQ